jgi:hypothetical protein
MLDRRAFLFSSAAAAAIPQRLLAAATVLRPEDFGARGDGVTNDTAAFGALSAAVNARGGGTVALARGRTYIVGAQHKGRGRFGWNPEPILDFRNLTAPLVIIGNGARLRCQSGLRFGTFDLATGEPVERPLPNYRRQEVATPYRAMISIESCKAPVTVRDIELDGNASGLRIGGKFGDKGWQMAADGLALTNNAASETVVNVRSHDHARDGVIIKGDDSRRARSRFSRFVARSNGRQGASIVGGRGYDFADCDFSRTGRGRVASAPSAGVDIEAEGKRVVRDLTFTRCSFADNKGVGLLASTGDGAEARFSGCTFVGTTSWSAWPNKPFFRFDDCTFVGALVHAFADKEDANRATRFTNCRFSDDPKRSPTGEVFGRGRPIADLGKSDNVLFDHCTFALVAEGVLPWSWRATYRDCIMSQRSPKQAKTKGLYLGRTTIDAPVDLYGSKIEGTLIVNGKLVKKGIHGGKPW